MRVILFANNRLGATVAEFLRLRGDDIAGVVLHPPERRKHGEEILAASGVRPGQELDASRLDRDEVREALAARGADAGVSVMFGYMLRAPIRSLFPRECVNLHPAYLPWNRGAYPNVWSIVERTPAGVTLHYVDEGVDTGDIIAQRRVAVEPHDTGETLYRRLEAASLELFRDAWPLFAEGRAERSPQSGEGSYHRVKDVEAIDAIDPGRAYAAGELVDILRARTFPPHAGAYLQDGDRRIHVRVELEEAEAK
jgi:methionyl-tRNA formyltransferase